MSSDQLGSDVLYSPTAKADYPTPLSSNTRLNRGTGLHSASSSVLSITLQYFTSTSGELTSSMFHPVLVVTLFRLERDMSWSRNEGRRTHVSDIFMSTTRFCMGSSRGNCPDGALEVIAQFKRLHEIPTSYPTQSERRTKSSRVRSSRVPNHAPVLDTDIFKVFINGANLLDTFIERFLGPEDSSIGLHGLLHVKTDLGSWLWAVRTPN